MANMLDQFYYQHFIYSSSDDDSDIIMAAALLIHDHNKKQWLRFKGSVKVEAFVLDCNIEVDHVQLYAD